MKILITADWHVRGERPLCRTDEDWIESQGWHLMAYYEEVEETERKKR